MPLSTPSQSDDDSTLAWAKELPWQPPQDLPQDSISRKRPPRRSPLAFTHPLNDVDSEDYVRQWSRGKIRHSRTFSNVSDPDTARDDRTHLPRRSSASESQVSPQSRSGIRKVIVHEVQPGDTIAGVALFYGIEVSTLKTHNKLWANDSIHVRKKLYIPLDACWNLLKSEQAVLDEDGGKITIIKRFRSNGTLSAMSAVSSPQPTTSNENHTQTTVASSRRSSVDSAISSGTSNSHSSSATNTITTPHRQSLGFYSSASLPATFTEASIRNLPAAQLSFFPPSSSSTTANSSLITKQRSRPPPPSLANIFPDISGSSYVTASSTSVSTSSSSSNFGLSTVMDTILACVPDSLTGSMRAKSLRDRRRQRRPESDETAGENARDDDEAVEDGMTWFKL